MSESNNKKYALVVALVGGAYCAVLFVLVVALFAVAAYNRHQIDRRPAEDMTLPAYLAQRPPQGARITGEARIFQNAGDHILVQFRADGKTETIMADTGARQGGRLFDIVKDGGTHPVTLHVRPTTYENRLGMTVDASRLVKVE